eukprot:CAMPEP_0169226992 /NCGR_PEP_ID=MMETSP1016-20121227/24061_1 /TAXON_ID=342587 /ORGANISM="Karlodinium micrum, Strain CCMP2283" /LENGTH=62 /DNA_ID=CAMNT_0009305671 /DNA_START=29 /DNA_END=213 /DNA_ORIENTATION=-
MTSAYYLLSTPMVLSGEFHDWFLFRTDVRNDVRDNRWLLQFSETIDLDDILLPTASCPLFDL